MIEIIKTTVQNIGIYLENRIHSHKGFGSRSFYGESFTLALLQDLNGLSDDVKDILIENYKRLDKEDPQFHWEFNNYALVNFLQLSPDQRILDICKNLHFKNTPCTNWTLLRSNTKLLKNVDCQIAIQEATGKISKYQLPSGLILDDKGVKSFQYHCFSMAMIAEMYETTKLTLFKNSFLKGVDFIRRFILDDGDTLYIGRGQQQSFGYGALIYILALAYSQTADKTILGDIDRVHRYLRSHQNSDGSFPLVMNGVEQPIPNIVDMTDPAFSGWYAYNNYFDYLPFMGFFIAKAVRILEKSCIKTVKYAKQGSYRDKDYIKHVTKNYVALAARPGGYWSNDMPIPYIKTGNRLHTPCYGGEQFQESLYNIEGIPLPFFGKLKKSIRWRSISFFRGNVLWLISPLGIMRRKYIFSEEQIEVKTRIFSLFTCVHLYHFLEKKPESFTKNNNLTYKGTSYSCLGELQSYASAGPYHKIVIDGLKNES